ncbi:hypothetical protein VZ94_10730 [Methylocucumis oryzae]|uniref:Copper resistance protein C n=1 Tax=Methylocucumis oryzae TaxID=1632867 RepID=A0A0F3II78_9GAMM|nr:hypothetical protein VZ94_10730 [Methylocucumis oryzae]
MAVVAAIGLVALPNNGQAEGVLLKSQPAHNARLSQFDNKISLWFSGNVGERYPSIVVVNSQGQRVDNRDVGLDIAPRSHLHVTTKPLSPDNYTLRYRVVTEDGLVVSGIQTFSIIP